MNSDPVRNYLNTFKNKMPPGYEFNINTERNNTDKIYTIKIKNIHKNRPAASLKFTLSDNKLNLTEGNTHMYNKNGNPTWNEPAYTSYRGKGFGAFLRAVATKAGWVARKNYGTHIGIFTSNKNKKIGKPGSTRILAPGWRPVSKSNYAIRSEFNYGTRPIGDVNKVILKIMNSWKHT